MSDKTLQLGVFVMVGEDVGVIVGLPDGRNVPDDHYAIWYGQATGGNTPMVRTVPMEYCIPVKDIEYRH